jgi:hypothetical protein
MINDQPECPAKDDQEALVSQGKRGFGGTFDGVPRGSSEQDWRDR